MSETIIVEAVSDKFKNKYSSGSVKVGDKWMQVSSKLDINSFQKGSQIDVETKTNDKGYTSIVALATEAVSTPKAKKVIKPVELPVTTLREEKASTGLSYEEAKNKKILVQGLTQAAITSPALAGLSYTNVKELAANAKALALEMIEFVREESK